MKKTLKNYTLFFCAAICCFLLYFLFSENGLVWTIKYIEKHNNNLRINNISGRLFNHIDLQGVDFQNTKIHLSIENINIHYSLWKIIFGELDINNLQLKNGKLNFSSTTNSSNPLHLHFPFAIKIHHGQISNFIYYKNNRQISIIHHVNLKGHINLQGYYHNFALDVENLNADLLKNHLSGAVHFSIKHNDVYIDKIYLATGHAFIEANGYLNSKYNLQWHIQIPNLNELIPNSSGSIDSIGDISGDANNPILKANINSNDFHFFDLTLKSISGLININFQNIENQNNVAINISGLTYKNYDLDSAKIVLTGNKERHQININLSNVSQKISAIFLGSFEKDRWKGQVKSINVILPKIGSWHDYQSTNLFVTQKEIKLDNTCLTNNSASVCLEGKWKKDNDAYISWVTKNIPLQDFEMLNQNNKTIVFSGNFSSAGKLIQNKSGKINAYANVKLNPGTIQAQQNQISQTINFTGGTASIKYDDNQLSSIGKLSLINNQEIQANISLPGFSFQNKNFGNAKINGEITAKLNQLAWIADLFPQVANIKGLLNLHANISGIINNPIFNLNAIISQGYLEVPKFGTKISNINLSINGNAKNSLQWQGQAKLGAGILHVTGQSHFQNEKITAQFHLTGTNLTLANIEKYQIIADPDTILNYADNIFLLTGNILMHNSNFYNNAFRKGSISLPDDIVIISPDVEEKQHNIDFKTNIHVVVGNDVKIISKSIQGTLQGALQIQYDLNAITTAIGEIYFVKGTFVAFGKELTIDNGKLIFDGGPITDPSLNIQASRVVNTTTSTQATLGEGFLNAMNFSQPGQVLVGLTLTGKLNRFQINLFSQPDIYTQSDILSLLLTGSATNNLSTANAQLLLGAASELNLPGGQVTNITQQLQNTFGLDQLGITSESVYSPTTQSILQTTSFVVGRHIGNRIYLSYSIGLFDPINIVRLRYQITPKWSLQTESSTLGRGVDVFYTFEK